ncbi:MULTISPECIES: O-antigen ligase family protein [unclassified Rhizobium]|uniref:O-antigen ligase family protein n=1 Tax=unclassified Rhizobium TaxID=2613769 RepID=UPI00071443D5|nr:MULTISPECIES: O-antigen ligase family protein [unclassified Rhizobium]KRD38236.1 O-antigen polymerase [Rhizobium sp. Root268]
METNDTPFPGRRTSTRGKAAEPVRAKSGLSLLVVFFLGSLFIPWLWSIGPVIISPFRLILIFSVVPCLFIWAGGKAGGFRFADFMILFHGLWCIVALAAVHGLTTGVQSGGIIFVETVGAYLLGRCFVRNADQFRAVVQVLFWAVAIILPFALVEVVTNKNVALSFFSSFFPTHVLAFNEPRWGFRRVQAVFEHPILFGVSCGAILALVHLVLGDRGTAFRRWTRSGVVLLTAFLSLSGGPMTAMAAQIGLLSWNWLLRNNEKRWLIVWALVAAMYVFISLASNQTVPEFYLTYFSFDKGSAYYRILIWHFGSGSALNHPLFGVGFNRWDRPMWMPGSIDMFWLYSAVLFGLPAGFSMMLAFLSTVWTIGLKKGLDATRLQYRTAFLIVMTGYFLVGWTVHFWNATYVLFLFLLGSGSWLVEVEKPAPARAKRQVRQPRLAPTTTPQPDPA